MIQFRHRIYKINTYKFETFDFNEKVIDKVELMMQIDYPKTDSHMIEVIGHFTFAIENGKTPILNISTGVTFDIQPEDFNGLKQQDGAIVIPHEAAIYIAGIAVGCTRGILSVRTENTKFSQFIIPPTDITEAIQGDVKINQTSAIGA